MRYESSTKFLFHVSEKLSVRTMTAPVNRKLRSVHSSFLPAPTVSKLSSLNSALAQEETLSLLPVAGHVFSPYFSSVLRSMWSTYIAKRFPPWFSVGVWMVLSLIRFSWQALAESGLVHVAAQGCLPSALAVITGLCLTSEHLLLSQRESDAENIHLSLIYQWCLSLSFSCLSNVTFSIVWNCAISKIFVRNLTKV